MQGGPTKASSIFLYSLIPAGALRVNLHKRRHPKPAAKKIQKLNEIPGNDELLAFLAYDTDRTRFRARHNGRRGTDAQEIKIAGQYDTMYMALSSLGYSSNDNFTA